MNIFGMTAKEFSDKINGKTEEQTKEDSDKKKVIGSSIGEESTNWHGVIQ